MSIQKLSLVVDRLALVRVEASTEAELCEYTRLIRSITRRTDALLVQIGARADELFDDGQCASPQDLFAGDGDVSSSTARRDTKRAKTASLLPTLGDALADGSIDGEKVDIAGRALNSLTNEQRDHLDTDGLVDAATSMSTDDFAREARRLADAAKDDWGLGRAIEEREKSELRMWRSAKTGMGHISIMLDFERFSAFQTQLAAEVNALAASRRGEDEAVTKDKYLAAEAFVSLIEKGTGSLGRPTIFVHVDADTAISGPHEGSVRETDCGHDVPPATIQRFLCDSVVRPVLIGAGGVVLNVGRKYRTATDYQWAALRTMYDSCAWAGCDRPIGWCQAHHISFWEHGGPTDLGNLIPLCSHHHHRVHEGRWGLHLAADRTLTISKPDGQPWKQTWPNRGRGAPSRPSGSQGVAPGWASSAPNQGTSGSQHAA